MYFRCPDKYISYRVKAFRKSNLHKFEFVFMFFGRKMTCTGHKFMTDAILEYKWAASSCREIINYQVSERPFITSREKRPIFDHPPSSSLFGPVFFYGSGIMFIWIVTLSNPP